MTAPALNHTHPFIQVLAGLSNVQMAWLDLDLVFSEEPLRTWHRDRLWMLSDRGMATVVSDAARVELLRRHGGTYIDLDAFSLRPLPAATNWLARIDDRLVGNAIMSFAAGHSLLQAVVADIPSSFEPSTCCSVGPDLLTRHLQRLCPRNITIPASAGFNQTEICGDITVWPSKLFCPIHYGYLRHQLPSLVREGEGLGPAFFKTSKAFSLHLFHSLSHRRPVSLEGDSILMEAANRNCPRVVEVLRRFKTYL
ncbi:alpha-1,4-N-acetylglucosaminyltransferase-like [Panulirus ornatus]|uniref:alpha-1,4-N-acetylglucosaminyltransferase-like n=1 Tax=Panulirus ornatus TaxID=150431 RepID=UPI003A863EA4